MRYMAARAYASIANAPKALQASKYVICAAQMLCTLHANRVIACGGSLLIVAFQNIFVQKLVDSVTHL
jgi:ABC-type uncharacterized transport system permease subunit